VTVKLTQPFTQRRTRAACGLVPKSSNVDYNRYFAYFWNYNLLQHQVLRVGTLTLCIV
jgi:hypothetical protein